MFNRLDLARVASASTGAQANWLYRTDDDLTTISDANYFGPSAPQFRVNDVIQCRISDRYVNLAVLTVDSPNNQVTTQQIDFVTPLDQQGLVNWRNVWEPGVYEKNDQVLDSGWLMIAKQTTDERAAPQNNGSPEYSLPTTPLWTELDDSSVVYSGNTWTFLVEGWVNSFRVWVPELTSSTNYRFILIKTAPGGIPETTTIEEPVLNENNWTTLGIGTSTITKGTTLAIAIDALNSGTSTDFAHEWTYQGIDNAVAPTVGGCNRRSSQDLIRIDKTDNTAVDRTAELASVIPGSTIRYQSTADLDQFWDYFVTSVLDSGSDYEYEVNLTDTGPNGGVPDLSNCLVSFSVPIPLPTKYDELTGSVPTPTWATVEGYLAFGEYDNVQPGSELNSYGTDILFQPAIVSSHWDVAALTGDGGAANTNAQYGDPVITQAGEQLNAKSFSVQNPTFLGKANEIEISFGPAQLPKLLADGTYISQARGQKTFTVALNFERVIAGGEVWLWVYSEINGNATSAEKIVIDNQRQRINYIFTVLESLEIGDEVKFFLFRDSTQMDDGGLYPAISVEAGVPDAVSAFLEVTNLVVTP